MTQRSLTSAGVAALLAILALTAVPLAGQAPIHGEERRRGEGVHAAPYAGRPA